MCLCVCVTLHAQLHKAFWKKMCSVLCLLSLISTGLLLATQKIGMTVHSLCVWNFKYFTQRYVGERWVPADWEKTFILEHPASSFKFGPFNLFFVCERFVWVGVYACDGGHQQGEEGWG